MLITRLRIFLALLALGVSSASYALPDIETLKNSLVTVVVRSDGSEYPSVGIALGNEQVLAIRPQPKNDLHFSVKPWTGDAVLLARPDAKDAEMDKQHPLMILRAPGLQLHAVSFLSGQPVAGLPAYSPVAQGGSYNIKRGALGARLEFQPLTGVLLKQPYGPILSLVAHNVLVTAEQLGSPLSNECGQLIAVSIADPRLSKAQRAQDPQDVMVALLTPQIIEWLEAVDVAVNIADEDCIGAEQQAQAAKRRAQEAEASVADAEAALRAALSRASTSEAQKAAAQQALQQAQTALEDAAQEAEASEAQKAAAQQALQQAQTALEDAAQNAETAQVDAEAAQAEISRIKEESAQQQSALFDKIKLYGGIATAGLLFILLLWLLNNRNKKAQIRAEREKTAEAERKAQNLIAQTEARLAPFDCILDGQDADGKHYLLKLYKSALGDAEGVILGRNPRNATFIIGHEEISREHARLTIDQGVLYVHDLGSANGTRVNGKILKTEAAVQLVDGATLDIGPITFSVKLIV